MNRAPFVLICLILTGLLAPLSGPSDLAADPPKSRAFLIRGPRPIRGINLLPPNTIPAHWGEYRIEDGEEKRRVEILFTRRELLLPRGWTDLRCGKRRLFHAPGEPAALIYQEPPHGSLFFIFQEPEEPWCPFVDQFIRRFWVLLGFARNQVDIPFPAVLELPTQ